MVNIILNLHAFDRKRHLDVPHTLRDTKTDDSLYKQRELKNCQPNPSLFPILSLVYEGFRDGLSPQHRPTLLWRGQQNIPHEKHRALDNFLRVYPQELPIFSTVSLVEVLSPPSLIWSCVFDVDDFLSGVSAFGAFPNRCFFIARNVFLYIIPFFSPANIKSAKTREKEIN